MALRPFKHPDVETVNKLLSYLDKNGFPEARDALSRELRMRADEREEHSSRAQSLSVFDTGEVSDHTAGISEPTVIFNSLYDLIEKCPDESAKLELSSLLFPLFLRIYLDLVSEKKCYRALDFLNNQALELLVKSQLVDSLWMLSRISMPHHLASGYMSQKKYPFRVQVGKSALSLLRPFVRTNPQIAGLLQKHIQIESSDTIPWRPIEIIHGLLGTSSGDTRYSANKGQVYYSCTTMRDEKLMEEPPAQSEKSKKKRNKIKETKSKKVDANIPARNRIPFPELSPTTTKQMLLSCPPDSQISLPSVYLYTLLNSEKGATCSRFGDDSTKLLAGFNDGSIRVYSLDNEKPKPMKSMMELENIDLDNWRGDVDDSLVFDLQSDEHSASSTNKDENFIFQTLFGHLGPVYGVDISIDKRLMVSSSEDSTLRIWSLETSSNVVILKPSKSPIWDVSFASMGFYMASGGADGQAYLWSTNRMTPIRAFSGHHSDINCVKIHPNSNYVITGSDDCSVRLWDILSGKCVRHFVGRKDSINDVCCSPDGRFIASVDSHGSLSLWDIPTSQLVLYNQLSSSKNLPLNSVSFSRDGGFIATGGMSGALTVLNIRGNLDNFTNNYDQYMCSRERFEEHLTSPGYYTFWTKSSALLATHFSRRNLLLSSGAFLESSE